jgi:transposase InsO family protein
MIHIDIKKLGKFNQIGHRITGDRKGQSNTRGVGWEYVHVCIDDASRVAFSKIMKTERRRSAVAFLKAAVAYYATLGVAVERVMTDNGSCYRSSTFRNACRRLGLKHIRTRPYTPKTNGKAERFVQTCLREWAYARAYLNSKQRARELPFFLHRYNWHRPHASISGKPTYQQTRSDRGRPVAHLERPLARRSPCELSPQHWPRRAFRSLGQSSRAQDIRHILPRSR